MKKILAALLWASSSVFATVGPPILDAISSEDAAKIEAMAAKAVQRNIGGRRLQNFKVDWNEPSNQCLEVKSEFDSSVSMGVCTVSFFAFQVTGHISVVKNGDGHYSVTVIHADVE